MDLFWICSSDIWSCDGVKLNNKFILVRCRWCLQGWIERVLEERTRRRWLFWCWGSSHSPQNWNYYLGNTNPECPGGEGTKNPWIDVCCTEEIQLPRGSCWALCRKGLCAIAQCESLRYKLLAGAPVRKACYGVVRFIMESGAKGCEVVVSGKLRGQRAKSMKFTDGFMIHSGYPIQEYIDMAVRHVYLRQGKRLHWVYTYILIVIQNLLRSWKM